MKNRKLILGFLAVLAAIFLFHYFSTEQVIGRELRSLVKKLSVQGPVPQLKQLTLASNIADHFHPEAELTLNSLVRGTNTLEGRQSVRDHALVMFRVIDYLVCQVTSMKVNGLVGDELHLKAEIKVQLSNEKDHFEIVPFLFIFKKHDGDWLIASVKNENPIGF